MNRHPLLIRHIRHLTDARYFAAMGVDWMSIELTSDPASFLLWHTLRDWVEGVSLAAEMNVLDEMLLARTIIDARPDGLIISSLPIPDVPEGITLFLETNAIPPSSSSPNVNLILNSISDIDSDHPEPARTFLTSDWSAASIQALLQAGYRGGFALQGGDEDITGVRDYTPIDEVLELFRS